MCGSISFKIFLGENIILTWLNIFAFGLACALLKLIFVWVKLANAIASDLDLPSCFAVELLF